MSTVSTDPRDGRRPTTTSGARRDPDLDPVEPPMHRPRPCPACARPSRDIRDDRCRACRIGAR